MNVWFLFKALNKNWAHCLENYKDVFLNRLLSIKFKKSCVHCSIMDTFHVINTGCRRRLLGQPKCITCTHIRCLICSIQFFSLYPLVSYKCSDLGNNLKTLYFYFASCIPNLCMYTFHNCDYLNVLLYSKLKL